MTKRKMQKGLASLLCLVLSLSLFPAMAFAEEGNAEPAAEEIAEDVVIEETAEEPREVVEEEAAVSEDGVPAIEEEAEPETEDRALTKLAAVSNLRWDEEYSGKFTFTINKPTLNSFRYELYRSGQSSPVYWRGVGYYPDDQLEELSDTFRSTMVEYGSGDYTVGVYSVGDKTTYSDSDTVKSQVFHYVRPSASLPQPAKPVLNGTTASLPVPGNIAGDICGARVEIGFSDTAEGTPRRLDAMDFISYSGDYSFTIDDYSLQRGGPGYYSVRFYFQSKNINAYNDSAWSEWSNPSKYPSDQQPTVITVSPALNLWDTIGIRFYIKLAEGLDPEDYNVNLYYSNKYRTIDDTCQLSSLPFKNGEYQFDALDAASDEMSDTVFLTIYRGRETVFEQEYTIASVANIWLAKEGYASVWPLLRAMLQYGDKAQGFFNNHPDQHITPDGAPALVPIPASYAPGTDPTTLSSYIEYCQFGINLETAVGMNIYIKPKAGYGLNDFTVKVTDAAGKAVATTAPAMVKGEIKVTVPGLFPEQLLDNYKITVSVKGVSAQYVRSVMNCAYNLQQKGTAVELVQALYQYCLAAKDYFGG